MHGCTVAMLHGCTVSRLHGRRVAEQQRCRVAGRPTPGVPCGDSPGQPPPPPIRRNFSFLRKLQPKISYPIGYLALFEKSKCRHRFRRFPFHENTIAMNMLNRTSMTMIGQPCSLGEICITGSP